MRERAASALILALSLCLWPAIARAQQAQFLGSITWTDTQADFGGFSGIELSENGTHLIAITDRGMMTEADVQRQGDQITGISAARLALIQRFDGRPLTPGHRDSEGLAMAPNGLLFISFEGYARILCRPVNLCKEALLPRPPAFDDLQHNSGLEALAIDALGRLYTLPERSGGIDTPFPVWRYDGGKWTQPFSIPRSAGFLPVGADFGPDGWLYILERGFNGIGFRSRVRRFDIGATGVLKEETVMQSAILQHDNLEGLSVWQDDAGRIRLTMISDDNFRLLQRTEIVEYALPSPLAKPATKP